MSATASPRPSWLLLCALPLLAVSSSCVNEQQASSTAQAQIEPRPQDERTSAQDERASVQDERAIDEPSAPGLPPPPLAHLPTGAERFVPYAPGYSARRSRSEGLDYLEVITGDAAASAKLPMIIALHGLGDTPSHFARQFAGLGVRARLILPRAPLPASFGGRSWFVFMPRHEHTAAMADAVHAVSDRIANLIIELTSSRPTLGRPIITGFSQGGMLAFALAVEHGELLGMSVPVSGHLPTLLWPMSLRAPARIVALHGRLDPLVLFEPTAQMVEHLREVGYDAELRVYERVGHRITPIVRRDLHILLEAEVERLLPDEELERLDHQTRKVFRAGKLHTGSRRKRTASEVAEPKPGETRSADTDGAAAEGGEPQ